MAGYTKSDYDRLYHIRVRIWDAAIQGYRRSPVRLHYHRAVMQDMIRVRWDSLVPLLGITSADRVLVVGSGFGWGVERLIELSGCIAVGIDFSDYINATKDSTEESEIDEAIIAAGYDPLTGHGLEVKNATFTGEPKSKQPILNENLLSAKSRGRIKKALGNKAPTLVITEDMITDMTDAEILNWKNQVDSLGASVCHVLRESYPPNAKTAEEWNAFTGHTIVVLGSFRRVGQWLYQPR